MLRKGLLLLGLLCSFGLHAAIGKRPSLSKLSWYQVMGKLISELDKSDRCLLYQILRDSERQKGAKKTVSFLVGVLSQSDIKNYFLISVISIYVGLIKEAIQRREKDQADGELLFESIEGILDSLFAFLQPAANEGICSPRGSSDQIVRKSRSLSSLSQEFLIEE